MWFYLIKSKKKSRFGYHFIVILLSLFLFIEILIVVCPSSENIGSMHYLLKMPVPVYIDIDAFFCRVQYLQWRYHAVGKSKMVVCTPHSTPYCYDLLVAQKIHALLNTLDILGLRIVSF